MPDPPGAIEMELHPCFQQPELFDYCVSRGIQPSVTAPWISFQTGADKVEGDCSDMEMPEVVKIAEAHRIHPALVCLEMGGTEGTDSDSVFRKGTAVYGKFEMCDGRSADRGRDGTDEEGGQKQPFDQRTGISLGRGQGMGRSLGYGRYDYKIKNGCMKIRAAALANMSAAALFERGG